VRLINTLTYILIYKIDVFILVTRYWLTFTVVVKELLPDASVVTVVHGI